MNQKGFSYIELSISSTVFSITAIGLLSLVANLTTSVQELSVVNQIKEQVNAKRVETLLGTEVIFTTTKIKNQKVFTPSPLTKEVKLKSAKLTELEISSSEQGKNYTIKHSISITLLPTPPTSIHTIHQLNLAYKPAS